MGGKEGGFAPRKGSGDVERDVEHLREHVVMSLWIEGCWEIECRKRRISEDSQAYKLDFGVMKWG